MHIRHLCYNEYMNTSDAERIKTNIKFLNESQLRKYLASEAISLGRGGISEVSAISGVHRKAVYHINGQHVTIHGRNAHKLCIYGPMPCRFHRFLPIAKRFLMAKTVTIRRRNGCE